ncbi:hypothetical protein [Catellatospora sichuanensis]|uniref:hypothetical protein n=1 Tax=Catellatospora sichuanensis TaxID=1969805 RepID=UPI001184466F|nr:hypothetical protein [Catellatospora sichuanensis]
MKVNWRHVIAAAAAAGLALGPASPARAHRGVLPTLHHDGRGSVWLTLAWDDGHRVDQPGLAMLSATGDSGASVPVTALRPLPHDPATLPLPGALAAGDWTVTVDVAAPGVGYCTARVHVAADGVPQTIPCAPAAADPALPPAPEPPGWLIGGLVAAAVIAAGVLWSRRRPARSAFDRRRPITAKKTRSSSMR